MVVDPQGRAYVGNFGFDLHAGEEPTATTLALVTQDGDVRVVADDLWFPNGTVIMPDGKTLIVAETFASRLTAFEIDPDGCGEGTLIVEEDGARAEIEITFCDGDVDGEPLALGF